MVARMFQKVLQLFEIRVVWDGWRGTGNFIEDKGVIHPIGDLRR